MLDMSIPCTYVVKSCHMTVHSFVSWDGMKSPLHVHSQDHLAIYGVSFVLADGENKV